MAERALAQREGAATITRVGAALVVTLPRELDDETLLALRLDVLERVRHGRVRWIVMEASGLELIDAEEFTYLATIARGAAWLGARTLLVGLAAGIVAYLVDARVDVAPFEPYASLDDALARIAAANAGAAAGTGPGAAPGAA